MKLRPAHEKILVALDGCTAPHGEFCVGFKRLAREADTDNIREVRRITRHLARKGLAEYHKALFTDDGYLAGAGYCVTDMGRAQVRGLR